MTLERGLLRTRVLKAEADALERLRRVEHEPGDEGPELGEGAETSSKRIS